MDKLPIELLWSIGQQIDDWDKRQLSKGSRRMHTAFGNLIFESLGGLFGVNPCVVKHLWRRPDLARFVKKIDFSHYDCQCHRFDRKDDSDRYYSDEDESVESYESYEDHYYKDRKIIEEMTSELWDGRYDWLWWQDHLKKRCDDAWLAVLLTRLTHLESLSLDPRGKSEFAPTIFKNLSFPFL